MPADEKSDVSQSDVEQKVLQAAYAAADAVIASADQRAGGESTEGYANAVVQLIDAWRKL